MGEYFSVQSSKLLHQAVIGKEELFGQLPKAKQRAIIASYDGLQNHSEKSFLIKSREAVEDLLFHTPSFTQAWLFFSFILCIMLLLRIEGATTAAWVLPLIALAFSVDNRWNGTQGTAPDAYLFPSEEYVVSHYSDKPLEGSYSDQKQQLLGAWHNYLVAEWTKEAPSEDTEIFSRQVEAGEHAFTTKRLETHLSAAGATSIRQPFGTKPVPLLLVYIFWNFFFALYVNRNK